MTVYMSTWSFISKNLAIIPLPFPPVISILNEIYLHLNFNQCFAHELGPFYLCIMYVNVSPLLPPSKLKAFSKIEMKAFDNVTEYVTLRRALT